MLDINILDWLNLLVRWSHVIFGIAWIGSSFYFVWQDNSLVPTADDPERERLQGEIWMVHGGGFYHARKFKLAPSDMPEHLHWFKWEAYSTWLSGFTLLVVVYWLQAATYMLPPESALTPFQSVIVGAVGLSAGWLIYDRLCKLVLAKNDWLLAGAVGVLLVALDLYFTHFLSGRAAYIHVGAALGTMMVANVFFVIMPNQRKSVAALLKGEVPDPVWGKRGKQRSVHNTYITLPVVFLMISNHFPMLYGHPYSWLVLLVLSALAAAVRHVFVLRHTDRDKPWMLPAALAGVVALTIAMAVSVPHTPRPTQTADTSTPGTPVGIAYAIVQARCMPCHSTHPTYEGISAPPAGMILETPALMHQNAEKLHTQAVVTQVMPLGNVTGITGEERTILDRWYQEGAKAE